MLKNSGDCELVTLFTNDYDLDVRLSDSKFTKEFMVYQDKVNNDGEGVVNYLIPYEDINSLSYLTNGEMVL